MSQRPQDHRLPGFNFNVEKWDAEGLHYETMAICRTLALARAAFAAAVEEKPAGRFMIRNGTRSVTGRLANQGKYVVQASGRAVRIQLRRAL